MFRILSLLAAGILTLGATQALAASATVEGLLDDVDDDEVEIKSDRGDSLEIHYDRMQAEFRQGGATVDPEQLREGARVRATFRSEASGWELLQLEVLDAP